jgi:hypothetical protein
MQSLEVTQRTRGGTRTRTFDALGHTFAVACEDDVAGVLDDAFAALAVNADPDDWYCVARGDASFTVARNGHILARAVDLVDAVERLRRDVNRRAVTAADGDLVLHAGAVELDGGAIVVSTPAHGGASTLVAALVAEGCGYLADEAVPVRLQDARVSPFPQPLALDDRALDLLPEIPTLRIGRTHDAAARRLVALRSTAGSTSTLPVAMVAFPERDWSGVTVVEPVSSDDAVVRLAERCFNFPRHGRVAIDTLTRLVADGAAVAVVGGDPRGSARALLDAFFSDPFSTSCSGHGPFIECAKGG